MDDVKWFAREECQLMLERRHQHSLWLPPEQAIAHHLIKAAVNIKASI